MAAYEGRVEVAEFLLSKRASVEAKEKYGRGPQRWNCGGEQRRGTAVVPSISPHILT